MSAALGEAAARTPWLPYRRPREGARLRLFAFAQGGGAASTFSSWPELFPPDVEVCAVQLPQRENRIAEPQYRRLSELVPALAEAIAPLCDLPSAFFGLSFGALLAFELAHHLRRRHGFGPSALFVASQAAPRLTVPPAETSDKLSEEAFAEAVRREGAVGPEVLADRDLFALVVPLLRVDSMLSETYRYERREPLDVPISAFRGRADPRVTVADMEPWGEETVEAFRPREIDSGHIVVEATRDAILPALLADLAAERLR